MCTMHSCTLVCENTILDGLGEALQAIHAGDEDVLYAAIEGLACGFHADSDTHSTHIRTVIPR